MTKDANKPLGEAEQKVRDRINTAIIDEIEVRNRINTAIIDRILAPRFNIQEVALATGMSTSAIRRAIKAGKIEATRNPKTNAYEMSALALSDAGLI